MSATRLHSADIIKQTSQGDYACSWCEYRIPTNSRHELQEWCSADVMGMFCSKRCASAATNNIYYRQKWGFKSGQ